MSKPSLTLAVVGGDKKVLEMLHNGVATQLCETIENVPVPGNRPQVPGPV